MRPAWPIDFDWTLLSCRCCQHPCLCRHPQQRGSRHTTLAFNTQPLKLTNRRGTIATPLPTSAASLSEPLAALRLGLDRLVYQAAAQLGARVDLKRLAHLQHMLTYQALKVFLTEAEAVAEDITSRLPRVWTSEAVFSRQLDALCEQCGHSRAQFDEAYVMLRRQGVIVRRSSGFGGVQMRVRLQTVA